MQGEIPTGGVGHLSWISCVAGNANLLRENKPVTPI
jgi:hypothetical protein